MNERAEAMASYEKPWAYVVLTKPDVTFLVVITTVAGFYLGSTGAMNWALLLNTVLATMLVAGGTAALNQYIEREMDAVMRRTAARPLPAGILRPRDVLIFGVGTIVAGALWLAIGVNVLSALVALATSLLYLGLYTPLKTRTPLSTAVGAIPGALPPLIGWAAARGSLGLGGWVLVAILFFWQFPHFMAIAWMYREDYARAGIRMLPVVDRSGDSTFRQIVCTSAILVWVSALPSVVGMAGKLYFFGALVLGMLLLQVGLWANRSRTNARAKWLMHATVAHIPLLLAWLILDKLVTR
ncbi:MAG TPA: heme o synthase [Candidatus Acidoferrales bacterium]|jgi:protoheme IX farnesyltransferase|nr:heme o synthase [Candidatus Acidoferrales bacterium]